MEPREQAKYMSWCNNYGIRIYVKVYGLKYKIVVETNGKEKIGEKLYAQKPIEKEENIWNEIIKLYKAYYDKNFKT